MRRCEMEECPFWAGDGCICDVLDIARDVVERGRALGLLDDEPTAPRTLSDIIREHSAGEWLP